MYGAILSFDVVHAVSPVIIMLQKVNKQEEKNMNLKFDYGS